MSGYPQTRPNWNVTEPEAGEVASLDPAGLQFTRKAEEAITFGVFVEPNGTGVNNIDAASTKTCGVALIDNLAGDYENKAYITNDVVAVARRGYFWVKIDTANKPAVGGAVRLSYATGKAGFLTSSAVQSREIGSDQGISIEQVLDTVAEVYLAGNPSMEISAAEALS